MWGIAWRSLLTTMLDYGFRIYGQLETFISSDWTFCHTQVLKKIAHGSMSIQCDMKGRLILIDQGGSQSAMDSDSDGFFETIRVSHKEALAILSRTDAVLSTQIKSLVEDWDLKPMLKDVSREGDTIDYPPVAPIIVPIINTQPDSDGGAKEEQNGDFEDNCSSGIKFDVGITSKSITKEVLNFYPGNTELTHLNTGIVGDLGTGKTQLIQALILKLTQDPSRNRGVTPNILIFDYKKDYSKDEFVKATGAKVIKPFEIPLNFFDTRDSELDPKRARSERFKFFADVLSKIYPNVGAVQRSRIKTAVKQSYVNADDLEHVAPTLSDVFSAYKNDGLKPDSPYSIMEDLVDDEYFVNDASKAVPFSEFLKGIVVIDLASVGQDDKTKNMLVVIFLNMFYEHMLKVNKKPFIGNDPQLRFVDSMLLVDEADNIMKYEFDVLKKILLQGREFGVGVLLASQYLSHYNTKHENYLEPLLTWFIHKVPDVTLRQLEQIGLTNVTPDVIQSIKSLAKHECLYKTFDVNGKFMRAEPFFEIKK
jgi:hypothetical protein